MNIDEFDIMIHYVRAHHSKCEPTGPRWILRARCSRWLRAVRAVPGASAQLRCYRPLSGARNLCVRRSICVLRAAAWGRGVINKLTAHHPCRVQRSSKFAFIVVIHLFDSNTARHVPVLFRSELLLRKQ